jgi:hypothetical protein
METLWLKSKLTISGGLMDQNAQGYAELYGQLQNAAQQGFPLSVVIDEPDARCNGLFSAQTNVNLVCQRRQGMAAIKQYNVVDCPIQIQAGLGGQSASCPTLLSTLEMHCKQGYKVASIYNPPTIQQSGFMGAQTACHIVFEKTQTQYSLYIFDVPFMVSLGFGSAQVDHQQYISVIQRFTQAGWELAAVLDMPDGKTTGMMSYRSTVKLIFQCRTDADPVVVMQVQCPQDSGPGQTIQVSHPQTGAAFQCTVPENVQPGVVFKIDLPASKDAPAPHLSMPGGSIVAAADGDTVPVLVPQGAGPGSTVQVTHPTTGATFQVVVPEGFVAGNTFNAKLG